MQKSNRSSSLEDICQLLSQSKTDNAQDLAKKHFPWKETNIKRKTFNKKQSLAIFRKDKFIDRYSGSRLLFPGALLAIG
jgi:hypothetical protein